MRRANHIFGFVAKLATIIALAAACAFGQGMTNGIMSPPANVRPPGLKNVGIQQNLNQPLPLDLTFTDGVLSAVDRNIRDAKFLQHTVAVNPGHSAGPLIDDTAQIVGLVCLKSDLDGVNFATPPEAIRALAQEPAHARRLRRLRGKDGDRRPHPRLLAGRAHRRDQSDQAQQ